MPAAAFSSVIWSRLDFCANASRALGLCDCVPDRAFQHRRLKLGLVEEIRSTCFGRRNVDFALPDARQQHDRRRQIALFDLLEKVETGGTAYPVIEETNIETAGFEPVNAPFVGLDPLKIELTRRHAFEALLRDEVVVFIVFDKKDAGRGHGTEIDLSLHARCIRAEARRSESRIVQSRERPRSGLQR